MSLPGCRACGRHRCAAGKIFLLRPPRQSLGRRSELIGDAAAGDPLVAVARDRDDRRTGESTGHAAVLDAADQRAALTQVARQRTGPREAEPIFAGGRLAPGGRRDRQAARGAARGGAPVIIAPPPRSAETREREEWGPNRK